MPKTLDPNLPLKRGAKIIAANPLPGVPEGTRGKIKVVNGFDWTRYWVFFDNGIDLGSVDHGDVVRQKDWQQFKIAREAERKAAEELAERIANGEVPDPAAPAAAGGGAEGGGGGNSSGVPDHLLERSRLARIRLGAPPA